MRKLLALCLLLGASAANAMPISEPHNIDSQNPVGYTYFDVTSEGYFDIDATNDTGGVAWTRTGWWFFPTHTQTNIDPYLFIFRNDGDLGFRDFVATDNNAGQFYNARVSDLFLGVGSYIAAVSDASSTAIQAILGFNTNAFAGSIDLTISAGSSSMNNLWGYTPVATLSPVNAVPEPTSLALLGLGLVAAAGVRRRSSSKV